MKTLLAFVAGGIAAAVLVAHLTGSFTPRLADQVAPIELTTVAGQASPEPTESTEPPEPVEPVRITLAGDSVMAGLAPTVEAALEATGDAEVEFVLTPSILRDATVRFTWSEQLEQFDPDVIVMFVGTWELGEVANAVGTSVGPDDPAWQQAYQREARRTGPCRYRKRNRDRSSEVNQIAEAHQRRSNTARHQHAVLR